MRSCAEGNKAGAERSSKTKDQELMIEDKSNSVFVRPNSGETLGMRTGPFLLLPAINFLDYFHQVMLGFLPLSNITQFRLHVVFLFFLPLPWFPDFLK